MAQVEWIGRHGDFEVDPVLVIQKSIDMACDREGLSDAELGARVAWKLRRPPFSGTAVDGWRHGQFLPPPEVVPILLELAGVPLTEAFATHWAAGVGNDEKLDGVDRRSFLRGTVGYVGLAALGLGTDAPAASRVTSAVLRQQWVTGMSSPDAVPDLGTLFAAVDSAKRKYQECHHLDVVRELPGLLRDLDAATDVLTGDDARRAEGLLADACQLDASIQIKLGNTGPAWVAADRSLVAAMRSEDPVVIASSGRTITHALMTSGHFDDAVASAIRMSNDLERSLAAPDGDALSTYGSLLLRGAVAAAGRGNYRSARDLLDEAALAAQRLGGDRNHRWTAFGPTNVLLHRVNIEIAFGEAGTAVELAGAIDRRNIQTPEREVALHLDMARAYSQWGRYDDAYEALRRAEEVAPEEVTQRPVSRQLASAVVANVPSGIRTSAADWSRRIGLAGA